MIQLSTAAAFSHGDMIVFFLSVALLIGVARILGELSERLGQPAILGELMAGLILGPSIFGALFPELQTSLFPSEGPVYIGLQFISSLAIALFLLLAGMEIDLRSVVKQGKTALSISLGGMVVPFGLGLLVAVYWPHMLGAEATNNRLAFVLFFATALSISALPMIARILMDLKLLKTHMGVTILSAAIVNDLIGWLIFAAVLGMIGASGPSHGLGFTLAATIGYATFMFTVGVTIIRRIYPWIQAHLTWPAGSLNFIIVGALLSAAFTEWLGIHAIFGTFIFGVAVGQCPHIREKTLHTLESFISFIITPIFFAAIGLEVNFLTSFDFTIVLIVLVVGTVGKLLGSLIGARIAGTKSREGMAIGWAMNARGVMEIILGLIAYKAGLISEELFVALVVFALITSMTSGTLMQKVLRRRNPTRLTKVLKKDRIIMSLEAKDREQALRNLCAFASAETSIPEADILKAVHEREELDATGLENGIAIPHCRLEGITTPYVFLARSEHGVDFHALDQSKSRVLFMIITPEGDPQSLLEVASDIAHIFTKPEATDAVMACEHPNEILAFINSKGH